MENMESADDILINSMEDDKVFNYIPKVGLEFALEEDAYNFYNEYGRRIGFSIRKERGNWNKHTRQLTSRLFVCSKEGFRVPDKRDYKTKNARAETRTGCRASMLIKFCKDIGKFQIKEFVAEHNHMLHVAHCAHMMRSQRKMSQAQAIEVGLVDESGRQADGHYGLGYTKEDLKNYLRSKRQRSLKYGEAGTLLKYFEQQRKENPSLFYSVQMDVEEQITNIFWADAKMIIDYHRFGEVVSFDTTYKTNKQYRPLAIFAGLNHHRTTTIFGAALMYDETVDSFTWLFETFLIAMSGKKPKTIFTDQDIALGKAILLVMPETYHRICLYHMMENALRDLGPKFSEESGLPGELSACVYKYEEIEDFHNAWDAMVNRHQIMDNNWVKEIYKIKEKWAKAYIKSVFSIGIASIQISESFNSSLKKHLQPDMNLLQFFGHFERVLHGKRFNELKSDFHLRQKLPKLKMKTPMLTQAGQIYTTAIFEKFQDEYEKFQAAFIEDKKEIDASLWLYIVAIYGESSTSKVICNEKDMNVTCSCKMFEMEGILCSHALKVLDIMNIKLIPDKYILKRWTKNAIDGYVPDLNGHDVEVNPKLQVTSRYRLLSTNMIKLASQAAECEEAYLFLGKVMKHASEKVEQIIKQKSGMEEDKQIPVASSQQSALGFEEVEKEYHLDNLGSIKAKELKQKESCEGRPPSS